MEELDVGGTSRMKSLVVAILAVLLATALTAPGASALTWTESSPFFSGQVANLKPDLHLAPGARFTGTISGTQVEISASQLEIVGGQLRQITSAAGLTATSLVLHGLTLIKPAGCSPPSSISSTELTGAVAASGSNAYLRFTPSSGSTFAKVTLSGTCAIAGTPFKITISNYACFQIAGLGLMFVSQPLTTSPSILSSCGGTLAAGGNPATLTLSGSAEVLSGASWGVV